MLKIILFFIIFLTNIYSSEKYVDYLVANSKKNDINISKKYDSYNKAYNQALSDYKKSILKLWPNIDISNSSKWVEYTNNYKFKKVIDFKKRLIYVEIITNGEQNASKNIVMLYEKLLNYDTFKAFKHDILTKKINHYLNTAQDLPLQNIKLLSDVLNKDEKINILKIATLQKYKKTKFKNNTIYKSKIKLPSDFTIRKAKQYLKLVNKYSANYITKELLLAVIHIESHFNPIARSHIPAFGLMQIVPKTAGIDAYYKLYGKKKLLSSRYLYKPSNNIKIGSAYLNILFFRYLKGIKDKKSRLICVIAAYNTGVTNLAKTFGRKTTRLEAINKINNLNYHQVYKKLLKRLPAKQTRLYLSKVTNAYKQYMKLNL